MNVSELIGKVVTLQLRNEITENRQETSEGTARYIIDCLTAEQTAAIAKLILDDELLSAKIDLKLPDSFVSQFGLTKLYFDNQSSHILP